MNSNAKCSECGAAIPADSPGRFCAQCLLKLGLQNPEPPAEAGPSAPGSTSTLSIEFPGERIGRYKLLQEIGHGGCGVVYMAEQEEPVRRKVALKVIKLGMDTRQVVARFEAERQALALMDHPNIAKIYDAGVTGLPLTPALSPTGGEGGRSPGEGCAGYRRPSDGRGAGGEGLSAGRPYFVMELVGGIKITDYCDQNNLTTRQRLDLFIQVCKAVQHAHQKGIIHRDLKPSNILVATQDGQPVPKVIDFGIAKATQGKLTDQTLFTAFEQFLGTPAYMSPEQAQLGGLDVDTRSDIYSLGVLLYELLTGTTPFDTKDLVAAGLDEMRRTIREIEPVKPSTRLTQAVISENRKPKSEIKSALRAPHSAIPSDLDWIVMKCLEKDRKRRYETANGLASDIQRHLNTEPVIARPPSKFYEFQKTFRRHKFGFAATAAIIIALAVGFGVATVQALRATRAEREQNRLRQEAENNLWSAYLSEARALRLSGQSGRHFDSLDALRKAAAIRPSLALRNEAILSMALPDLRHLAGKDFTTNRQKVLLDASLEKYAIVELDGTASIRRWEDDKVLTRIPGTREAVVNVGAFSPNGEFLTVGYADGRWRIWNLTAPTQAIQIRTHFSLAFSPDNRSLASSDGTNIVLIALPNGAQIAEISLNGLGSRRAPGSICFDPTGQRLALYGTEAATNVTILDVRSGKTLVTFQHDSFLWYVAWHPDARRLAIAASDRTIHLWDTVNNKRIRLWRTGANIRVGFNPAGEILASSGWEGYTRLWDSDSGRQLSGIQNHAGHLFGFDKEARRLALGGWDGLSLEILEVARGECLRSVYDAENPAGGGAGTPILNANGNLLAFRTQEGIGLWNSETMQLLSQLLGEQNQNDKAIIGFDASGTNLILSASEGLFRCQITVSSEQTPGFLGKPILVSTECADPVAGRMGWISAAGSTCATIGNNRCQFFRTDTFAKQAETDSQPGMRFGALNPDGSLLASGAWHAGGVRVWDTQTGRLAAKLLSEQEREDTATTVAFAPDGRHLVTATLSGYSFWKVGTWSLTHHIPSPPGDTFISRMAFSPDGRLFAASYSGLKIRLYVAATGETLADLEVPDSGSITGLTFSPDGTRLFTGQSADALRVWDLRLIRRQLAELGLDWD